MLERGFISSVREFLKSSYLINSIMNLSPISVYDMSINSTSVAVKKD